MKRYSNSQSEYRYRSIPSVSGTLVLAASIFLLQSTQIAFTQEVVVVDVDVKEVAKGYRASELTGAEVDNGTGDVIGSIDDLIVDREKVLFAILEVGGFLGIGGYLVAIPFNSLEISEDGATIVLAEGSKEDLEQLPEFQYQEE